MNKKRINKMTDYSIKKYKKAYLKLEEYDKGINKKAKLLSDPEGLYREFQSL
ncbi:MAG: hypothetical protein ABIJ05_02695 [Patescibacteria group bacterium]